MVWRYRFALIGPQTAVLMLSENPRHDRLRPDPASLSSACPSPDPDVLMDWVREHRVFETLRTHRAARTDARRRLSSRRASDSRAWSAGPLQAASAIHAGRLRRSARKVFGSRSWCCISQRRPLPPSVRERTAHRRRVAAGWLQPSLQPNGPTVTGRSRQRPLLRSGRNCWLEAPTAGCGRCRTLPRI